MAYITGAVGAFTLGSRALALVGLLLAPPAIDLETAPVGTLALTREEWGRKVAALYHEVFNTAKLSVLRLVQAIVGPIFETLFTVSPESRAVFAEWGGILISDIVPPTSAPLDPTFSVRPIAGFTFPNNRDHSRQLSRLCEGAVWAAFESGRTSVPQYRRSLGELFLAAHPTGRGAGINATVLDARDACKRGKRMIGWLVSILNLSHHVHVSPSASKRSGSQTDRSTIIG
ncbi:hypothetical protein FA95DRAFT_1609792 [Auriscalpium vulgare]|uniref:Uncharacterized protein n=1 Tax=Auriscalpium vulgare TaxID=40419 RepID=A0ACB8RH34_9AGAM|nr:hypothetical protein FA95DRAFT_1609792 [Auriscalpium vulgare]